MFASTFRRVSGVGCRLGVGTETGMDGGEGMEGRGFEGRPIRPIFIGSGNLSNVSLHPQPDILHCSSQFPDLNTVLHLAHITTKSLS